MLWPPQEDATGGSGAEEGLGNTELAAAPELDAAPPTQIEGPADGVAREEMVDPVASMEANLQLGYAPERDILVRAELTMIDGEQGHPPKDCEGWTVSAQTWISETGEIARFEAVSDKKGIAEFHFPDFIHVDWLLCVPPEGSGFAVSFYEGHDDLGPDDDYHVLLPMVPAKGAYGHVQDQEGRPVAGAVVHAFDEGWTYGLNDWTPGYLTTETDGNGRFAFEQLPPGTWVFAVEPEQWLMMHPVLERQREGSGEAVIRADATEDAYVGILQVVPMVAVELTMLGSNGVPAVGASLYLEPKTLDDWFVKDLVDANMSEEEKVEAMFSSDSRNLSDDLPYSFYFLSDREGKVRLRLLRGRYDMMVSTLPGMMEGDENPPMEFHTDQGNLVYRFQAPLSELGGTVLSRDGAPIRGASIGLQWRTGEDSWDDLDRDSHASGRFLFQSVRIGGEFRVSIWPGTDRWLPLDRPLSRADFGGDLELVLDPAEKLLIAFEMERPSNSLTFVKVLDFQPRDGERFDPDAQWWHNVMHRHSNLSRNDRVNISWLQPGTYVVALYHARLDSESGMEPHPTEIGRWTLETGEDWQEVKVNLPR